ncbi:hypothetical protein PHAVU_003G282900 [Phaseolus vulgaris]|uniref:uncharacterized protein isoform X2 n=1 Tax=Phaseolus vulgaris TaxID=3885 RepID=UPI0035CC813E
MDNESNPTLHVGTAAFSLPPKGRSEDRDEQEKQGSPKRQKRDEVAEEFKNEENINIDEGDNSEERHEETQEKKMEVLMDTTSNAQECDSKNAENDSSSHSSYDSNHDDNNSDFIDKPHMATNPVKSSENSEEEIEENASKTGQVNPEMLATLKERNAGSKTIYTKNLSYSVERADLEILFKDCGEIVDVRLHTDYEGRFRGFGHVEFATEEAVLKALKLNNTELLRCRIRIGVAPARRKCTPNRSFHVNYFSNKYQGSERIQPVRCSKISEDCEQETEEKDSKAVQKIPKVLDTWKQQNATSKTICARNLSYSVESDDIEILFKECGEIVDIRLQTDHEGRSRGFGYVQFATTEAAQKALELDNTKWFGRWISVVLAQEKGEYASNRSFSNWSNSFNKCERIEPFKRTGSSEYCEEDTEGKVLKDPWKSSSWLATMKEENASSKTIYVKNLSYRVEQADVEFFFKECGEIIDVRLHRDNEGRLKGFGHIEFATAEAALKALELDNTELLRRCIGVEIARGKGEHTWNRSNSFQKHERFQPMKTTEYSEDCEEEIEKKAHESPHESPKMLPTLKEQNASSNTIYVGNLSCGVEQADVENLFKECGGIVYVHPHTDHEGRPKGFLHVEFSTAEAAQKALVLDHTELFGRPIRVELAREKSYSYSKSHWSNSFQSLAVYVKGFDCSLMEEEIKANLEEHFGSCGEITRISIPKFYDSGAFKGFAVLDFKDLDSVKRALELDQTEIGGYTLLVEKARARRDNQSVDGTRGGGRDGNGSNKGVGWGESGGWHSGGVSFVGEDKFEGGCGVGSRDM